MSAYPSLPLFTDAFIADTSHLSAQETGAYLLLLMVAWRSPDCRLPDDDARLARYARVDRRTWLRIKGTVLEFWTLADGFWTQKRLSKERVIVSKRAEAARENGKHGGRPKSLIDNDQANPAGSAGVSGSKAPNPNPNPTVKGEATPHPVAQKADDFPPKAFDLWWELWPHKVARLGAERAFTRIRKGGRVTYQQLCDGVRRYKANKPETRDWCYPTTWLNEGRWDDQPAGPVPPRPNGYPQRVSGLTSLAEQKIAARRQEATRDRTIDMDNDLFPAGGRDAGAGPAEGPRPAGRDGRWPERGQPGTVHDFPGRRAHG